MRRTPGVLGLVVAMCAAVVAFAPDASANGCNANDCVTVSAASSAPAAAVGDSVTLTYTFSAIDPILTSVFTDTQTVGLAADASTVQLDGTPLPAVQVGDGFTATLGALAPGGHTVAFTASATQTATAAHPDFTSTGQIDFTCSLCGAGSGTDSASVTVNAVGGNWALNVLDPVNPTQVLADYGYSETLDIAHDTGTDADTAKLTVELPPGLVPSSSELFVVNDDGTLGTQANCGPGANPAQAVCDIAAVTVGDFATYAYFVASDHSQAPGTHADVQFHVAPTDGVDPSPTDADATTHILFVGAPDVQYSLTPADTATIRVGTTKTFDLAITNNGPDTSPESLAILLLDPPSDGVNAPFGYSATGTGIVGGAPIEWHGSVAPGQTRHVTIKVNALIAGRTGTLSVIDATYSSPPECYSDPSCFVVAQVDLKTVAADVVPPVVGKVHVVGVTDASGRTITGTPTVARGGTLHFRVAGFKAHEKVQVSLHSSVRELGTVQADAAGALDYTLTVPDDLSLGSHRIYFSGASGVTYVDFTVTEALANSGAAPRFALVAGVLSVLLGLGLVLASRRRRGMLGD